MTGSKRMHAASTLPRVSRDRSFVSLNSSPGPVVKREEWIERPAATILESIEGTDSPYGYTDQGTSRTLQGEGTQRSGRQVDSAQRLTSISRQPAPGQGLSKGARQKRNRREREEAQAILRGDWQGAGGQAVEKAKRLLKNYERRQRKAKRRTENRAKAPLIQPSKSEPKYFVSHPLSSYGFRGSGTVDDPFRLDESSLPIPQMSSTKELPAKNLDKQKTLFLEGCPGEDSGKACQTRLAINPSKFPQKTSDVELEKTRDDMARQKITASNRYLPPSHGPTTSTGKFDMPSPRASHKAAQMPLFSFTSTTTAAKPAWEILKPALHPGPSWTQDESNHEPKSGTRTSTAFPINPFTSTPTFTYNNPQPVGVEKPKPKAVFGRPSEPIAGFSRPFWVPQNAQKSAEDQLGSERSLENLLKDYPDRKLRGIEPDTLQLVARTIQQVSEEAAQKWLKKACPNTKWADKMISVESIYDFGLRKPDYSLLDRAVSLQSTKDQVVTLLFKARSYHRQTDSPLSLINLVQMIDHCIAVCKAVEEDNCKVLLEQTKVDVEWLPIGLDCKKLEFQRRANHEFHDLKHRLQTSMPNAKANTIKKHLDKGGLEILDRTLVDFQELRLEFLVRILKTLQKLLVATA